MSIAEKLQTIAENEQRVYDAGYEKGKAEVGGGEEVWYSADGRCYTETITIPEGVTTIGQYAFCNCTKLQSVRFPTTLKQIQTAAFHTCNSIISISLPSGITTLGMACFQRCTSLENINLPNSLTTIGPTVFYECRNLKKIAIPSSVTSIGSQAFWGGTVLTTIELGQGINCTGLTFDTAVLSADTMIDTPIVNNHQE